ncbi:MAG TPA: hypothetical protein VFI31_28425 [Pirellulales bacterium]|nr:hypothetical protein [Pirellulales bacterium]
MFVAMTVVAAVAAAVPPFCRFWQSLDLWGFCVVTIFLPLGIGATLLLAALSFAYHRAVSQINRTAPRSRTTRVVRLP